MTEPLRTTGLEMIYSSEIQLEQTMPENLMRRAFLSFIGALPIAHAVRQSSQRGLRVEDLNRLNGLMILTTLN
jgi:hypothetical protein